MEQSSAQNRMPGLPHTRTAQGPSSQFWNSMEPMYPDSQIQPSQSQQPQDPSSQQPLGISWDHPVLQQQQPMLQPQQTQMTSPNDPSLELYSIPQSWQPNPLHQPGRGGYVPSPQYQTAQSLQQPLQQFPSNHMQYDSRSLQASESSAFPSYSFPPNFYPQQLSVQDSFQTRNPQQHSQPAEFQVPTPQPALSQFAAPSGYPPSELHNTIDLTEDFPSEPGHHHTIDPQFLNPITQSAERQAMNNNFMYGNPAEFDRAGGHVFNYFENGISAQPQFRIGPDHAAPQNGMSTSGHTGFPVPEGVIAVKKPTKKQSTKKTTKKENKAKAAGSESSDSELEIEAPPEPSPIPAVRPIEPVAAAVYDTLQAVWSPRNKRVSADKVKNGLMAFKEIIKTLRDAWKDQVQAMKNAENQGDNDKAAELRKGVILQRQTMDKIMTTAMEMGHPVIVEKCGEHPVALAAIYSFLADRFQAADFEGSLTINMIKLLAQFITVDEEILQKTNLAKLLPRFIKKGGPSIKESAQKILDNAAAATKWKQKIAETAAEDSSGKGSSADSPSEIAGSKRPRDGESNVQPATKRMVVTSNPKDASKPVVPANGVGKRPVEGAQNGKPAITAAPRPRPNVVAPKPSSLFGALSSASKRPGTTNAERAAAIAAGKSTPATEKKEKPAAPPPKPAFSFGDIMADLSKPKETVVVKPTEERPPETEEERTKRLRKEERRKLRVTWKPEESLTEVRLFTHDPDEELGPGDGSLRSAGDVKGEGSVLKLHKDLEELEEDDLGGIRETSYGEYPALTEIVIESDEMKNGNFIKRGGKQIPNSPEKEAQDHREATTLMVFHTSPADVPSTPKEPPAPDADEVVPDVIPFGELPDNIKARQERYFEYMNPKPPPPPPAQLQPQPQPQPNQAAGGFDISNILKMIHAGTQQQSTPPPQTVQQPAAPMSDLERTINMFRQQQPIVPQAPVPQAPVGGLDFQNILNVMKQLQPNVYTQPQQTQPTIAPNIGAMFGQFNGPTQQSGPPQLMQPANSYEDPERMKRMRDEDVPADGQYDPSWSRQKRTKANDPKPYKYGLVACKFWAEGKCRKGENCTFRHDTPASQRP